MIIILCWFSIFIVGDATLGHNHALSDIMKQKKYINDPSMDGVAVIRTRDDRVISREFVYLLSYVFSHVHASFIFHKPFVIKLWSFNKPSLLGPQTLQLKNTRDPNPLDIMQYFQRCYLCSLGSKVILPTKLAFNTGWHCTCSTCKRVLKSQKTLHKAFNTWYPRKS